MTNALENLREYRYKLFVEERDQLEERADYSPSPSEGTLGAVLYGRKGKRLIDEAEWAALVRSIAAGEQLALHALYAKAQRPVFTLAVRITSSREIAEEVTVDVFHDVWRRATAYDPANGTVLGWIMNQARSRAIDRLRFERRKKRLDPGGDAHEAAETHDLLEMLELKERGEALRAALAILSSDERLAIDAAYFAGLSHAEVAARLSQPLGTVKTRIRTALRKLRAAMDSEGRTP